MPSLSHALITCRVIGFACFATSRTRSDHIYGRRKYHAAWRVDRRQETWLVSGSSFSLEGGALSLRIGVSGERTCSPFATIVGAVVVFPFLTLVKENTAFCLIPHVRGLLSAVCVNDVTLAGQVVTRLKQRSLCELCGGNWTPLRTKVTFKESGVSDEHATTEIHFNCFSKETTLFIFSFGIYSYLGKRKLIFVCPDKE